MQRIYHSQGAGEPMNQDQGRTSGAGRGARGWGEGVRARWEARIQALFTDLSERGETRVEEWSRRLRQTDIWLRTLEARERVAGQVERVATQWERLAKAAYNKAGVATEQQLEELNEELRQLQWRVDRLTQRGQETAAAPGAEEPPSEDLRSLA